MCVGVGVSVGVGVGVGVGEGRQGQRAGAASRMRLCEGLEDMDIPEGATSGLSRKTVEKEAGADRKHVSTKAPERARHGEKRSQGQAATMDPEV